MENKNWQDEAVKDSGIKVPEWELEPTGAEQKENIEASAEAEPSVAEKRLEELKAETKEVPLENPEQKSAQVEALRAEVAEMAKPEQKPAVQEAPKIQQEQVVFMQVAPKAELSAVGKTRVFMKRMFGKELTPEENAYHLSVLKDNFTKAVEKGDLDKVLKNYSEINNERYNRRVDKEQFSQYQEEVNNITRKAVVSGDSKTFDKILSFNMKQGLNNGPAFTKQDLGLKEGETVSPEISKVATEHLSRIVKSSFSGQFNEGMENYKERLDRWVESGVISREDFNKLPLVRDLIKKDIVRTAKIMFSKNSHYGDPEGRFDRFLENTDTGVFSKQEVQGWKEIKRLAK